MDKELIEKAKLSGLGRVLKLDHPENIEAFKEFHRLATEKAVREALEWLPIDTAPMDGTEILLMGGKNNRIASGCFGYDPKAHMKPRGWVWPYIHLEPTQWMPLRALIPAGEKS